MFVFSLDKHLLSGYLFAKIHNAKGFHRNSGNFHDFIKVPIEIIILEYEIRANL